MGGKGGGGGGGNWQDVYATNPKTGGVMRDASGGLVTKAQYAQMQADEAAAQRPAPAPAAAPVAPEPEAPPPPPPAPPPEPPGPIGPAIGAGSGIEQPTSAGNALGDSVLNPPNFWVGGLDQYKPANPAGRSGRGRMTFTQT